MNYNTKNESSITDNGLQPYAGCFSQLALRVLLCPRCGITALNFNRSTVFLIFFCGWTKNNLFENQQVTGINTK